LGNTASHYLTRADNKIPLSRLHLTHMTCALNVTIRNASAYFQFDYSPTIDFAAKQNIS